MNNLKYNRLASVDQLGLLCLSDIAGRWLKLLTFLNFLKCVLVEVRRIQSELV